MADKVQLEDQIFDHMLERKSRKLTRKSHDSSPNEESDECGPSSLERLGHNQASSHIGIAQLASIRDSGRNYDKDSGLGVMDDMFTTSPFSPSSTGHTQPLPQNFSNVGKGDSPNLTFTSHDPMNSFNESHQMESFTPAFSAEVVSSFQFTLSPPSSIPKMVSHSVALKRTETIEKACIIFISQGLNITQPLQAPQSPKQFDSMRAAIAKVDHDSGIAVDISKIGIDLISRLNGFSPYLYGVGANDGMEKVLRWRCSPSQANRMAIPEPFRPTPLQFMSFDHPCAIDFVNWPTIRDQVCTH
jgi:hypothetical protein